MNTFITNVQSFVLVLTTVSQPNNKEHVKTRKLFSVSSLWSYLIAQCRLFLMSRCYVMSAFLITSLGVVLHTHLSSHPPLSLSLSLSTLSTLIDFTLMFDSFFPSAPPPSRCRLPRRFLRSAALVLAISYSLSSRPASLISSLFFCWVLPFHYGSCHKTSRPLRKRCRGSKMVGVVVIYSSSTTIEDMWPLPRTAQWS